MVALKYLREFMELAVRRVEGLHGAVLVSVEAGMADRIKGIAEAATPVVFYLPPSARSQGRNVDSLREVSECVAFVMAKFIPRTDSSAAVLERVQPVLEGFKGLLLQELCQPCASMRLDPGSISILPETEFFGNWAGWSIAFTVIG